MPTSHMGDRDKRWVTRGRARHVGDERGGRKGGTEGEQKEVHRYPSAASMRTSFMIASYPFDLNLPRHLWVRRCMRGCKMERRVGWGGAVRVRQRASKRQR